MDNEQGRFTLIFVAAPGDEDAQIELTHNWDEAGYGEGRNFGHVAYEVDNVYETCRRLMDGGVTINRPPREGRNLHAVSRPGAVARARRAIVRRRGGCAGGRVPGTQHNTAAWIGHRLHTQDPRAPRLFELAMELELEGEHVRMLRALNGRSQRTRIKTAACCPRTWTARLPRYRRTSGSATSWGTRSSSSHACQD